MTEDTSEDQSVIYRDYFETVKAFNLANAQYLTTADEIATQRQKAIQRVIEIHINPVLSTMRSIQIGSVVAGVLSFIFMCGGINLAGNSSSGFGTFLILAALVLGVVALIVFSWTSSKISDLRNSVNWAIQKKLPDIPN